MGSNWSTSGAMKPSAVLEAYQKYLPGIMQAVGEVTPDLALQQAQASIGASQLENAANLAQVREFGLPLAEAGQDIINSNTLAGSRTNLSQLSGPGGAVARAGSSLNRELNPAYYSAADSAGRGASDLVSAINLQGLSSGEANAIERSNNQNLTRTGNLGLVNPTNTIANAMNFGGAYNQKVGIMANALNSASNVAGQTASNGGLNPVGLAMAQPAGQTQSNFGAGQFINNTPQGSAAATGNAFNTAGGMFNNLTGLNSAAAQAGASMANATSPQASATAAYSGCCFIFLESCHGTLPLTVRRARDRFYRRYPKMASGYKRMAKWLVPLMRKSQVVSWLVWKLMVERAILHTQHPLSSRINKAFSRFWLNFWYVTGKA